MGQRGDQNAPRERYRPKWALEHSSFAFAKVNPAYRLPAFGRNDRTATANETGNDSG